jgi:hypothetical protein
LRIWSVVRVMPIMGGSSTANYRKAAARTIDADQSGVRF